jgi:nucleotide-binding universal stress UspA family protein
MESPWPKSAHFIVISVVGWPVVSGPGEILSRLAVKDLLADQEKRHRQIADKAAGEIQKAGLSAESRMIVGDPRFVLEEEARKEGAQLIIVGTYGWTGVKKLLLGSVASYLVTHAHCSVLVVRKT